MVLEIFELLIVTTARRRSRELREQALPVVAEIVREFGLTDLGEGMVFHIHPVHELLASIRKQRMRIALQLCHLKPMKRHLHVPPGKDTAVVAPQYRPYRSTQFRDPWHLVDAEQED